MSQPRTPKASPHDVKKAFGVHAERCLEVIDSHADCLEGLILQVEALTVLTNTLKERSVAPQGLRARLRWMLKG